MRIAQVSDFHYTQMTWNPFRLFSKRLFGNLNWLFKRKSEFSREPLKKLPELFKDLKVDFILLGGDFTSTAVKEEYVLAKQFISNLSQPWIAIPGNHDHYTYWSFKTKRFYQYLNNQRKGISCSADFFTLKDHGVEAHLISSNEWVVALDTARATNPYSSRGLFSKKLEAYLTEILQLIPKSAHITLLNHYPFFQNDERRRTLERGDALRELIQKDGRIRLYLHGHTHRHTIANLQPNDLPLILDSGSCAKKNRGTWNLIDLSSNHCEVSVYTWNKDWQKTRTETFLWTRE